MSQSHARPRVATFINGLWVGGAEVALLRLLDATKSDFEHMVISLVGGGELAYEFRSAGIAVVEAGARGWMSSPGRMWTSIRALKEFKPDLITAHMYYAALTATAVRPFAAPAAPLHWIIHHSLNQEGRESRSTRQGLRACRLLSRASDAIVYVSARSAEQHAAYGFRSDKSIVIPNGYNQEHFRVDSEARSRLRAEWGISEDEIVVGHVGRLHPMKDHGNLIAALRLARKKDPRLRVVFCGLRTETLDLPDDIRPHVLRLGIRSDVAQVMNACDFGCLSSAFGEALPNVLVEFMSCERPCVTTDVGDAAEIVSDYGKVVPPLDPAALAGAIVQLAALPATERATLGKAARASVADRFAIAGVGARHANLWRRAVNGAAK